MIRTGRPARTQFAMFDKAWLEMPMTSVQLKVLLGLSLHADWTRNGNGRCFPKRETLARECHLTISQVSEGLRALEALGVICTAHLGRKNVYYVRPIGAPATFAMPPSGPEPFFAYLAKYDQIFDVGPDGELRQISGDISRMHPIYKTIASEYEMHLTEERLRQAVEAREEQPAA